MTCKKSSLRGRQPGHCSNIAQLSGSRAARTPHEASDFYSSVMMALSTCDQWKLVRLFHRRYAYMYGITNQTLTLKRQRDQSHSEREMQQRQNEEKNERDSTVVAETQSSPWVPQRINHTWYRLSKDPFMRVTMEISATCRCVCACVLFDISNMHAGKVNQSVSVSINHLYLPPCSCCVKWWKKLSSVWRQ